MALLKRFGNKLFHLHMNDNYRSWDDDMIPGSVHTPEWMEFFWWLDKNAVERVLESGDAMVATRLVREALLGIEHEVHVLHGDGAEEDLGLAGEDGCVADSLAVLEADLDQPYHGQLGQATIGQLCPDALDLGQVELALDVLVYAELIGAALSTRVRTVRLRTFSVDR